MNKSFHIYNIERQIEDKFNSLMKSGKMSITPTLQESTIRRNIQIDEEHDEDILQAKRDEYYKDKTYKCVKCKAIKMRSEFFHLRDNAEGISSHCKVCEMKYKRSMIERG
jgi:hypothetical protein